MNKLKSYLLIAWGVLTALFYVLLKSKDRKIDRQQDEIKQHKSKNEELSFINQKEQESKNVQDHINTSSESDVDKLLECHKAYRD
ncbi:hypothetical protein PE074_06525 [Wohlfahrtiimonas chitiniclastica]|uniref:hypothetical protein n=1 Tax=Wohlfahrtiimonas chitiniclastica TaxID=400946 RepID=UPI0007B401F1|nr:hypothetical protein [Wohlfahrtiimonas chitiniclastica]MBS7814775.1 hypothetical protein [Wohlfahrtiimonas chitiniclastica]WHR54750.1 hypothetical protein PE074_06525 [Wohlfahrtiimonas chitiniclastica]